MPQRQDDDAATGWGDESATGLRALPAPQHPPGHVKELRMQQRMPGLLQPQHAGDRCCRGADLSPGRMKMLKTAGLALRPPWISQKTRNQLFC